ncbi:hypothetical protein OJAV_G00142950 [Oryzias javanicus]|uniref:Uncharacterized protein n=1 Tax=Oryzias javanicus TaxID=123683 RepID=A0A437CMV7_ORYJA|nr:hypothetical protein OJAV_G00142950 [Oryzias javanicus]
MFEKKNKHQFEIIAQCEKTEQTVAGPHTGSNSCISGARCPEQLEVLSTSDGRCACEVCQLKTASILGQEERVVDYRCLAATELH